MSLLGYKNIPTLDIYFRNPLKDLIAEKRLSYSKKPIQRFGPNTFFTHEQAIIVRYVTENELKKISAMNCRHCYYLIDDDFSVLDKDISLPADYRHRLLRFSKEHLPGILELADTIVAPNPLIHRAYPGKQHELLHPSRTSLCHDLSHFDSPDRIELLFAGTRSHVSDLLLIGDVLAELCRRYPQVRLTTFMGEHAPAQLPVGESIVHRRARSWRAFQQVLKRERFHIALAPYRDTPFNRARSINKVLDHAAFGAAGLYSDRPPMAGTIENGVSGLLLGDDPQQWFAALDDLMADISRAKKLAQQGISLAGKLGDPAQVRAFWLQRLGLNPRA